MKTRALATAGCATLLFLSTACGKEENTERAARAGATPDTARLRSVYGQIDSAYDSLMARYESMTSELSAEGRQLFESMRQMRAQATRMHGLMIGGGMMGGGGMRGGRDMMRGGAARMGLGAAREWDQQMLSIHQAMAAMFRRAGAQDMAGLHERMARLYGQALEYAPPAEGAAPEGAEGAAGPSVYAQSCAPCHGPDGQGVAGAFPPLASSPRVAGGDAETPIRIVLHGLQGPIQVGGQAFDGVMPAFGARLTDQELAAVLSYVRSAFGNDASMVDPGRIAAVRQADADRTAAMTPDELR